MTDIFPTHPKLRGIPFLAGLPAAETPETASAIKEMAAKYTGASFGQKQMSPAWVNDHGVPCVVLLAHHKGVPGMIRESGLMRAIVYRWNVSTTGFVSITIQYGPEGKDVPRPHVRWMAHDDHPAVQALRRTGRALLNVVGTDGRSSGWFDTKFKEDPLTGLPDVSILENQFQTFGLRGLPGGRMGVRFSLDAPKLEDDEIGIPMWKETISDYWNTLEYSGPWALDLDANDKARIPWARAAWAKRADAAALVQIALERIEIDGAAPAVLEDGTWNPSSAAAEAAATLFEKAPPIKPLMQAICGPRPKAWEAYAAALDVLREPYALFCAFDKLPDLVRLHGDEDLMQTVFFTLSAALLDSTITDSGARRPWIGNTGGHGLALKSMPLDLTAPLHDITEFWRNLEAAELIDIGDKLGPSDFPAPSATINEVMGKLVLEGTVEQAEEQVLQLLHEAQEARQWSIPWGARVEVSIGPFVAVRIYESSGEFACHFLDNLERYFFVSIGLNNTPPRMTTGRIVRLRSDDGEPMWNEDAMVTMRLIAAAIVRDFLVVEERESLFSSRSMRKRVRGKDVRQIIYLPRVHYSKPDAGALANPPEDIDAGARTRHSVAPHLRKAKEASAEQRFLAQRYGMRVPVGFTFVRPHERGLATEDKERIRIYRSRSASRMLFQEIAKAPEGNRPAWFEFEKDCARLLQGRGMRVIHQAANRDGDGGIDLFATDETGQAFVVQCKCWSSHRTVGPEVVRELEGAIRLASAGSANLSRGILVTTSTFTSGAVTAAGALGFELIDGARFAKLIR